MYCIFKLFWRSFKQLPVIQFWELMSKNEIWRTISCIYFMKIWVDLCFVTSEVSLLGTYTQTQNSWWWLVVAVFDNDSDSEHWLMITYIHNEAFRIDKTLFWYNKKIQKVWKKGCTSISKEQKPPNLC